MRAIVVTPAGRRRYLHILARHLAKQKQDFDEWHLWANTRRPQDKRFMTDLAKQHPWIKIITRRFPRGIKEGTSVGIVPFWDYPHDPDTIYIRFDDDVLWMADNAIATLTRFKIAHPQHPLVFANIVNNNVIAHIHQQIGAFSCDTPIDYNCMGSLWKSKTLPLAIHQQFMKAIDTGSTSSWKFDDRVVDQYERISINCICWRGGDIDFPSTIRDEEQHVACTVPRSLERPAIICGDALVVHGAFYPQRSKKLEDLLQQYSRYC